MNQPTVPTATPLPLMLEAIDFSYTHATGGRVDVLAGQDLAVEPGQVTVVAGRSGSGKTTLLKIACGLLSPDHGEVRWGDIRLDSLGEDKLADWRRAHTGIVSQGGGLIDFLTAAENVAIAGFGNRNGQPQERVEELLEHVGLAGRDRHVPDQLSAGEQQRVALARALFNDPVLLVADEPTANLDRRNADAVINLLAGLSRSDRSILVASHDPTMIEAADHLVELD